MSQASNRNRLAHNVYRELQARLVSLVIRPGERITIDGLARDLGVSQSPIREAMALLEKDGLVVKTHLVGYHATPQLTREQFEELFELRLLIEPYAARRAAENKSAECAEFLHSANQRMADEADRAGEMTYSVFAELDAELHDEIASASGNSLLRDQLAKLHSHLHLFRLHNDSAAPLEAISEHSILIEAVTSGNGRAAERAMRSHLERSRARFRVVIDRLDID